MWFSHKNLKKELTKRMPILSLEHGVLIGKKDVWRFHKMVIMLKILVIFEQIPCFSYVKYICWSTICGYRIQTQKYWRSKRLILLFLVMTHYWEFKFKFFITNHLKNIWQISLTSDNELKELFILIGILNS